MTVKRSIFAMAVFVVAAAFAAPTGEGGDKAKRFVLCDPLLKAPAALIVVGALLVLPSIYTWYNVVAFWDPYSATGNLKVALVNQDEGA